MCENVCLGEEKCIFYVFDKENMSKRRNYVGVWETLCVRAHESGVCMREDNVYFQ